MSYLFGKSISNPFREYPAAGRRCVALFIFVLAAAAASMQQCYGLAPTGKDTLPVGFDCLIRPWYKYRPDGQPGREVTLVFRGGKLHGTATVTVDCDSVTETHTVTEAKGVTELPVLLPAEAGVRDLCQARFSVTVAGTTIRRSVVVPSQRQWTVYIYPHSHVDIGYTNTQDFVRRLHMKNIDVGIELAERTANYPVGSRFVWNPEAGWVTENYLQTATLEKKKAFIDAVRKGWISLDANYDNSNTSACSDEELLQLFHASKKLAKITGVPIRTMVQFDVAGASWGIAQAAFQYGIKGFFYFPNLGTVRKPWENQPFYWVSPDGKSKILFYQAFPYGFGYNIKGSKIGIGKVQGATDTTLDRITTSDPTANFLDPLIFDETEKLEAKGSPYDIFVMPWSLADNSLIDADLPDAVRLWNQKYAYPKLIISGSARILHDFTARYDSIIPRISGDFTEYWTDGLGSDARRVGMNRRAVENIVQAETAWSMLDYEKPSPRKQIDEAWKNALLAAEHTWGYQDPRAPLARKIEANKASYFEEALHRSDTLLKEALESIAAPGSNRIAVINTLSWDRSGLVTLSAAESRAGDRVVDEDGKEVPSQRLSTGVLAFWATVPSLGAEVYTVEKGRPSFKRGCRIQGNTLSNRFFSVTVDPKTGHISSLRDFAMKQEYVDQASVYGLNSYLYVLGADTTNRPAFPSRVTLRIKENGPLVASIVARSEAPGCRSLSREVRVVYGQPWVDLIDTLDKISTRVKESVHFGFAFNIPRATMRMDIPWGIMIPGYDQIPAANHNWLTFQRWVDLSNATTGVTWTSIEAPLIEYGQLTPNVRGWGRGKQNSLKATIRPQPIFSWVLNNYWNTNFPLEQGGIITLHYGVLPHGPYRASETTRFGLEENRPFLAVPVSQKPRVDHWVKIRNPNVFVSVLKQSDDGKGMVLRLRSVSSVPEKVSLTWTDGAQHRLYRCLADEKLGAEIQGDQTILPYGTISYYVEK